MSYSKSRTKKDIELQESIICEKEDFEKENERIMLEQQSYSSQFECLLLPEFKHMIKNFIMKESKITESMIKVNPNDLSDDALDSKEQLDPIKIYFDEDSWTAVQNLVETKKKLLCKLNKASSVTSVRPKRNIKPKCIN